MDAEPFYTFDDDPFVEDEPEPASVRMVPGEGNVSHIPTWYRGIRYRSRTEARWAFFFDRVAIPHQHEEQPYGVDGSGFLPDFRLPDRGIDVEVKRDKFTIDGMTQRLYQAYAEGTGRPLLVVIGWPDVASVDPEGWYGTLYRGSIGPNPAVFAECHACRRVGVLISLASAFHRDFWLATSGCRCRTHPVVLVGPAINEAIAELKGYDWESSR